MVAKKGTVLNKSAEIRKALARYPDKGPAAIARMLTEQHKVPFRNKHVSIVKARQAHMPAPAEKPSAPAAARQTAVQRRPAGSAVPAGGIAAMVTNLQAYIQRLGKEDLHRLIDTL